MATIDRYNMKDGEDSYIAENSSDIHKSTRNGETFGYINFNEASKDEILAYYQGIVDKMIIDRNFQRTDSQGTPLQQNSNYGQGMNQGKENTNGKVLTLSNGHSILGNDSQFPGNMAFTDRLLITLLAGIGIGVVMTAIYIFINIGKVTISL